MTMSNNGLPSYSIRSLDFTDLLHGYACGNEGGIYRTLDGGYNWEKIYCPSNKDLWNVCFPTPEKGWIVGRDGTILHSSDSGATWIPQIAANLWNLMDVEFIDEMNGWASGFSENFMYTKDGGQTWTYQPMPTNGIYTYIGVKFSDPLHGYLGACYYESMTSARFVLYYTSDAGNTWEKLGARKYPSDVCFIDLSRGWMAEESPYGPSRECRYPRAPGMIIIR